MFKRFVDVLLAAGSAQLFWYLSLPIISRLYSPEDLGKYGSLYAFVGVGVLLIGARSDIAILASKPKFVGAVHNAFYKLNFYIWLMLALVVLPVGVIWTGLDARVLMLLLLSIYSLNRFLTLGSLLIKNDDYLLLKKSALLRSSLQAILQITLYKLGFLALVLGKLIADFFAVIYREKNIQIDSGMLLNKRDYVCIKRNSKVIKYSLPQSILNSVSQYLPLLILPIYMSSDFVGQYALSFFLSVAPIGLVGTPLRQVFLREVADLRIRVAKFRLCKILAVIFPIAIVVYILFYLVGQFFIGVVFGDKWDLLWEISMWLLAWSLCGLFALPSIAILHAWSMNRFHFYVEVISMLGRVVALSSGIYFFEGVSVISLYVIWNIFMVFLLVCAVLVNGERNAE